MEYITIATAGDGTDFGDLSVASRWMSLQVCLMFIPSRNLLLAAIHRLFQSNVMRLYNCSKSTGNATDFGNLTVAGYLTEAAHKTMLEVLFLQEAQLVGLSDTIDYITIGSTGNATDFGDHTVGNATSTDSVLRNSFNQLYAYHNRYSVHQTAKKNIQWLQQLMLLLLVYMDRIGEPRSSGISMMLEKVGLRAMRLVDKLRYIIM